MLSLSNHSGTMTDGDVFDLTSFPNGARALVVGASRGIGLALALDLAGAPQVERLFVASRKPEASSAMVELVDAAASPVETLAIDVVDEASVVAAARSLSARTQRLDLIINCAGMLHDGAGLEPERKLAHVVPDNLDKLFRIHGAAPLLLAKHFGPLLPRRERFVFASLSARVGSIGDNRLGGWYGYRVSKAAHNMAIKTLSVELARRSRAGVCVALHPGTVDTDLSRPFSDRVPADKLFTPARASRQLLSVIDSLESRDNGGFFAWDGSRIPW